MLSLKIMNDLKVTAKLTHFSAEILPSGELNLATLPADVLAAVERMRQLLEDVPPGDRQAIRRVVEDPSLAVDAPMDAPVWEVTIDCPSGGNVTFRVTENCGRQDAQTVMTFLEAKLPKVRRGGQT